MGQSNTLLPSPSHKWPTLFSNPERTQRLLSVGAGLTALDLTYGYNNNSQINSILDGSTAGIGAAGKTHSVSGLTYDGLGQLTHADGWWGAGAFNYDELGNITSKTLGTRLITMSYESSDELPPPTTLRPLERHSHLS